MILKIYIAILTVFTLALIQPVSAQDAPSPGTDTVSKETPQKSSNESYAAIIVKASNTWLQDYAKLKPLKKYLLRRTAIGVAKFRRVAFKRLIQRDPEDAILLSLSPGQRQGLPKFVLKHLETLVHEKGDLVLSITETLPRVLNDSPQDSINLPVTEPPSSVSSWTVRIGQTTREAFVYGFRLQHQTKFDTPIHGVALDEHMAISGSPLYRYDPFETIQLGFKPGQIVATSGGLPIPLPDIKAFIDLEQELIDQILRFGPLPFPFHPNEWTTGIKNLLVVKVMYRNDPREPPYSDADITAWVGGANSFFIENSQGLTSFNTTVVSTPIQVREIESYRFPGGHNILRDEALLALTASTSINPDDYDRIVFLAPQLFDDPAATAAIGGKVVTVTGETPDLRVSLAHELGHTYGFSHSGYQDLTSINPITPVGSPLEYGDAWDMMGTADLESTTGDPQRRHFNAFFKALAGWLPDTAVSDGTLGGDFRLRAHDAAVPVGTRAVFVEAGDGSTYWLGRRSQFPGNTSMVNGIEVRRVDNYPSAAYGPVLLLDLDLVFSGADRRDFHSLGFEAIDAVNGITIRVVVIAEDHLGEFARVFITR